MPQVLKDEVRWRIEDAALREDLERGRLDARAHLVLEDLGHQASNSRG